MPYQNRDIELKESKIFVYTNLEALWSPTYTYDVHTPLKPKTSVFQNRARHNAVGVIHILLSRLCPYGVTRYFYFFYIYEMFTVHINIHMLWILANLFRFIHCIVHVFPFFQNVTNLIRLFQDSNFNYATLQ